MKNLLLFTLALSALILQSCSDEEIQQSIPEPESKDSILFNKEAEGAGQENAYSAYETLLNSFGSTSRSAEKEYPSWYGGCFVNDNDQLVILTTDLKNKPSSEIPNTVLEECTYSYNELSKIVEEIREASIKSEDFFFSNISIFGIETPTNSVSVGLRYLSDDLITEFKNKICSHPAISFVECGEIKLTSSLLTDGGKIINKSKGSGASMGYRAKTSDGKIGIVTAGHFIAKDQILASSSGVEVGKCLYSRDRDGLLDAAFCEVTNKDYTPSNEISFMTDAAKDTLSIDLAQPPTGYTINMVGAESKRVSGTVYAESKDVVLNGTKKILSDAILMSCLPKDGDSGGIVYALTKSINKRSTVGIIMGVAPYTINGVYSPKGVCVKAYLINQTFGIKRY
ncbi:MAG: S1 family peptidase [Muribaculum sp.]|nr:S1 family peptidase [Muribaculum sp.]